MLGVKCCSVHVEKARRTKWLFLFSAFPTVRIFRQFTGAGWWLIYLWGLLKLATKCVWPESSNSEGNRCVSGEKNLSATFSYFLPVAAPDLLDPKSATQNTKPRLSFSTKPITLTPREETEVRDQHIWVVFAHNAGRELIILSPYISLSAMIWANVLCSWGFINEFKHRRWLPQWWRGRQWQQSFFWWFCTWWWELLSSGHWSSLMRGKK